jgi:hypothetical protein
MGGKRTAVVAVVLAIVLAGGAGIVLSSPGRAARTDADGRGAQPAPTVATAAPAGEDTPEAPKIVAGIPELEEAERPTVGFLRKGFATGLVRFKVTLKVLGWQGSANGRGLIVRLLSAQGKGPGKVKDRLDIEHNDYIVALAREVERPKDLERAPTTIEFRPTRDGFAAFLP